MSEYIKREDATDALLFELSGTGYQSRAISAIKYIPSVKVVEAKHGEWVLGRVEPGYATPGGNRPWICSECGQVESWRLDKPKTNFCSNCGADMR